MDFFTILTFLGGIALFLFGMDTMGKYLEKLSGGKLEKVLAKLTSKRITAVIFGALVTAILQSSTTTSVMVVGLVNSGIMKLSQAVGVLMGANIGTTITAWILSLAGLGDEAPFVLQLFKPAALAGILGIIGILMRMISKKEKRRDIGTILLGFSLLMFGMTTMANAVAPLAELPEVQELLLKFSNPILGVLVGLLITVLVQSSATSIGILQAFCVSGAVTYAVAIPIIMGQNIGTCFKALISAIGASKNAKRASFVHLYFNMIGTVLFLALFYISHAIFRFEFVNEAAGADNIAFIHSMFNIGTTLVLFPFAGIIEKLATLTVPEVKKGDDSENKEFKLLDVRFLDTPTFAIEQCKAVTLNMANIAKAALFTAVDIVANYDRDKAERVAQLEEEADVYEDELGNYLVKVTNKRLSKKDSNAVTKILHCISDFERISDHALNIKEAAEEMNKKGIKFSGEAQKELDVLIRAVENIVSETVEAFATEDLSVARKVEPLEQVIDDLTQQIKGRHIDRLVKGKCTIELGFVLTDLITNYERISDHCSNIAIAVIQMNQDVEGAHEYLDKIRTGADRDYSKEYMADEETYALPVVSEE
ncbi:MAG: Na/Pi cotransporter family protein [Lachnospiraceae bacterium]|nr:Na/Pi cotransporter family protein [Lachnospiraceae bacterium]